MTVFWPVCIQISIIKANLDNPSSTVLFAGLAHFQIVVCETEDSTVF